MTTELLPPTWANEDLPALLAAVQLVDQEGSGDIARVAQVAGLDSTAASRALVRLDGEYLRVEFQRTANLDVYFAYVQGVTPAGRRVSGQWPDADRLTADVVAELERIADQSGDKGSHTKNFLRGAGAEFSTMLGAAVGAALKANGLGF